MRFIYCLLFSLFVIQETPAYIQNESTVNQYSAADTLPENLGLFDSNEILTISLQFDITQYKKKKFKKDYFDAILSYQSSNKESINQEIKVRARGNFRLTYCDLPPLLLNFKMEDSTKGEFSGVNKLKMVTHCITGNNNILLKEYLTYKLYNVITENSFKVRLLKVNYINTSGKGKTLSEFAFVIEPEELLARRLNSAEVTTTNLTQKIIIPEMMDRLAIFNYMIGNTDWSVPINHNVLILTQGNPERPGTGIIVPYDFDYSGLVNAHYATPYEGLRIKSVRERMYLGICRSEKVYIKALSEFSDKKEALYKVINEFVYLDAKSKEDMISYLNSFFKDFDKNNTLAKKMLSDCIYF